MLSTRRLVTIGAFATAGLLTMTGAAQASGTGTVGTSGSGPAGSVTADCTFVADLPSTTFSKVTVAISGKAVAVATSPADPIEFTRVLCTITGGGAGLTAPGTVAVAAGKAEFDRTLDPTICAYASASTLLGRTINAPTNCHPL